MQLKEYKKYLLKQDPTTWIDFLILHGLTEPCLSFPMARQAPGGRAAREDAQGGPVEALEEAPDISGNIGGY